MAAVSRWGWEHLHHPFPAPVSRGTGHCGRSLWENHLVILNQVDCGHLNLQSYLLVAPLRRRSWKCLMSVSG